MRVIAGTARSIPLEAPQGMQTRPTTDRIKETLFNMLSPLLPGCFFADLFAGSGGIGIEALSRGAAAAVFVESDRRARTVIEKNLKKCRLEDRAAVLGERLPQAVELLKAYKPEGARGIYFMDPPYDMGMEEAVLKALAASGLLDENSLIVLEQSLKGSIGSELLSLFSIEKEKVYKSQKHVFLKLRNGVREEEE